MKPETGRPYAAPDGHSQQPRRIAVVGCGHVGAVTAACFAEMGHCVRGVDTNERLIEALSGGRAPFVEPGLVDLLAAHTTGGRLSFTTSFAEALAGAEFVFVCVNTPSTALGAADLSYVRQAVSQITSALVASGGCPPLVTKSTSPIGTCETIEAILDRSFAGRQERPSIVTNPEFLREGSAVADFFRPERIVVGAANSSVARRVAALYDSIEAPCILTDIRTAEMIKYASNALLATRLSFINEVARLCEHLGADIDMVVQGVSLDPRLGRGYLNPGIGFGGSCLPKDVAALLHTGDSAGVPMQVLASVQAANLAQRKHAVNCIRRMLGTLEGRIVAAWGVTFKGGSEDLRESPALSVIELLQNEGARVKLYDPSLTSRHQPDFAGEICESALDAVAGVDCLALLSDWPEFTQVDLGAVCRAMAGRQVYDGRNLLSRADVEAAGLRYYGVGRPSTSPASLRGRVGRGYARGL